MSLTIIFKKIKLKLLTQICIKYVNGGGDKL